MINNHPHKKPLSTLTTVLLGLATLLIVLHPLQAEDTSDPRPQATAAMLTWLQEIDQNQYAQSWKDASDFFQKKVSSDQWVTALNSVRTPLGACKERKLASALHQTEVPLPTGGTLKGDFVVAQFNSSFDNLQNARETVSFEKTSDGTWKADGYYIKPN